MKDLRANLAAAQTVLVPSGKGFDYCAKVLKEELGLTVPAFPVRKLVAVGADGRRYIKVKDKDVPGLLLAGYGDIGFTGTDISAHQPDWQTTAVQWQPLGGPMCRYDLLVPEEKLPAVLAQLGDPQAPALTVATTLPQLLAECTIRHQLNLAVNQFAPSGSVEAMIELGLVDAIADLVESGQTAKANGLVSAMALETIYMAAVWYDPASRSAAAPVSPADIAAIDQTLEQRSQQRHCDDVDSYTLQLLRDPNKAGKKLGEEAAEIMMAIYGNTTVADCEGEIADLVYASLVAAHSQGKTVKLERILGILAKRNQASSLKTTAKPKAATAKALPKAKTKSKSQPVLAGDPRP